MQPPHFTSRESYAERFTDAAFWRPYVEAVCARHGLAHGGQLQPGLPGTNAVFIVAGQFVVKLYPPLFDSAESFAAELDLYGLLARLPDFPAPALVAHGALFPEDPRWSWPYIVTRVMPGTSFGEVRAQVPFADRLALAEALGPLVRRLHDLDLNSARHLRPGWDAFVGFLEEQRGACVANNLRWRTMPDHLIRQLDSYLPHVEELLDRTTRPRLLHCDLNEDHILGRFENGRWRLTGIIDFGDVKVGDRLYELATMHMGLFRCDKRLLRRFLERYGFDEGLRQRFVLRAMSYTLLHEFDVLGQVFQSSPAARAIARLDELAALLWDLEGPGVEMGL